MIKTKPCLQNSPQSMLPRKGSMGGFSLVNVVSVKGDFPTADSGSRTNALCATPSVYFRLWP